MLLMVVSSSRLIGVRRLFVRKYCRCENYGLVFGRRGIEGLCERRWRPQGALGVSQPLFKVIVIRRDEEVSYRMHLPS